MNNTILYKYLYLCLIHFENAFLYTTLGTKKRIAFRVVSSLVEMNKILNISQIIHILSSSQSEVGLNSSGEGIFFLIRFIEYSGRWMKLNKYIFNNEIKRLLKYEYLVEVTFKVIKNMSD